MSSQPNILRLRADPAPVAGARFTRAEVIPARAMMLYQLWADVPGLGEIGVLASPPVVEGLARFDDDPYGNAAFSMGAAFLAPFVNRIRGRYRPDRREIETIVSGRAVSLAANGGGKAPGAEQYAIHGLILDRPAEAVKETPVAGGQGVTAVLSAGDFDGRWLSRTELDFRLELTAEAFRAVVTARNAGDEPLPIGLGWHPYFNLPSGRREQARLRLPARARLPVNNYDEVLPTGAVEPVAGSPYDFGGADGRVLGDLYLDDCFVALDRTPDGRIVCQIQDPAAGYAIQVISASPQISAIQTYAPPDKAFVVIEPQFSWANPYGDEWPAGVDTGMVLLEPGETVDYAVELRVFLLERNACAWRGLMRP